MKNRKTRLTGAFLGQITGTLKKAFQALRGVLPSHLQRLKLTGRALDPKQVERTGSIPVRRATVPSEILGSSRGNGPFWHYVIIRNDLPRGVIAAQTVHAAGESSPGNLPENTRAVVLAARDALHLEQIEAELVRHEIAHQAIREPDPPYLNAIMAIGLVPVADRKKVQKVTSRLPLLK